MVPETDFKISTHGFQLLVRTAPSRLEEINGRRRLHDVREEAAYFIGVQQFEQALGVAERLGLYGENVRKAFSDYLDPAHVERAIPLGPYASVQSDSR